MSILEVRVIDKKKLILLILSAFWLFMVKGPVKDQVYRPPKRTRKEKEKETVSMNYGGLMSRKQVKLQIEGNIFEGTLPAAEDSYLEEVSEEDLIRDEMNRIIFLGYLSEEESTLFIEYDGEFYEILNGEGIEIEVQDKRFMVSIDLMEEDVLTLYEPQKKITIMREI